MPKEKIRSQTYDGVLVGLPGYWNILKQYNEIKYTVNIMLRYQITATFLKKTCLFFKTPDYSS